MGAVETCEKKTFQEVFVEENTLAKIDVNAQDLYEAYIAGLHYAIETGKGSPLIEDDLQFYKEFGVPEHFKYLDLCFLLMKNGHIVTGVSSPADVSQYRRWIGVEYAMRDAVDKGAALQAYETKSKLIPNDPRESVTLPQLTVENFPLQVQHRPLNAGMALERMLGLENVPTNFFNLDICVIYPQNQFMSVGTSQPAAPIRYLPYVNRDHALALAMTNLLPMAIYQARNAL